jgi:hypothetical protein
MARFQSGRPCVHRRSRGRHQELRPWLARPRGDGRGAPRRRGGAELDLAAAARARLRGGARGRRLGERPTAAPAAARRRPAWRHLAPDLGRARRGSTARARPHVGLLRGGLPEAGRGRGRLRALPASQALGPRTGLAAAHRGGGLRRHLRRFPLPPPSRPPRSGSSPRPIARRTTSCTTSSTRFPVSDRCARRRDSPLVRT